MKTTTMTRLAVLGLAALVAACAQEGLELNRADGFGNAVRHNMEAQVVNPNPTPDPSPIALEGERAAIALQRYQADKVKQPRALRTTEISVFGGGGK